jgi:NADH-quinone oxidoreductase subunit L
MLALGVASMEQPGGYAASMFHLFTHAFFKALLFLGAGVLIHAVHSNDLRRMGGLAKKMPVSHATFLVATLAIAGIWPLAGFFSKDEILLAAWETGYTGVFAVALVTAGLTAFYMFRLYFLSYWGEARSEGSRGAHEAPVVMLIPLLVLGVLSVIAGFFPVQAFVSLEAFKGGMHWEIAIPATLVALAGIALAWRMYGRERTPAELGGVAARAHSLLENKFYVDEAYLFVTRRIIFRLIAGPIAWFDRRVVDDMVDFSGWLTRKSGEGLSRLQTGQVQTYGAWLAGGALLIVLWFWLA